MAELVVTLKGREIQRFPITQRVTNIGRSQNSDLSLSNESVSRDHARLSYVNRTFFIERVTEHNLVLLNETECVAPMPVEDGTRIQIGKYTIVLHKMGGPSLGLIDGDSFSSMGSTEVLSTHDINRYAQSLDEPETSTLFRTDSAWQGAVSSESQHFVKASDHLQLSAQYLSFESISIGTESPLSTHHEMSTPSHKATIAKAYKVVISSGELIEMSPIRP